MEILYKNILLRDMMESDIDNEIRWRTVETHWKEWDGPWVDLPALDPQAYRKKRLEAIHDLKEEPRRGFHVDTEDGAHIGMVTSYLLDENWEKISEDQEKPGQKVLRALGIDIFESRYWGQGLGTQALTAFVQYYLDQGISRLCLQTWSGNIRMMCCAEHIGFAVCSRKPGFRRVCGKAYDGLTFQLDIKAFRRYLLTENLKELQLGGAAALQVLDAYDRRPGWYLWQANHAYDGEVPDFPICKCKPLERLVIWCCHMTQVRQQYQKMHIPDTVIRDTFSDLSLRAGLYEQKYGKPGFSKGDVVWFRHIHLGQGGMRRGLYDLFCRAEAGASGGNAGSECPYSAGGASGSC